jgi:hypothetical protein
MKTLSMKHKRCRFALIIVLAVVGSGAASALTTWAIIAKRLGPVQLEDGLAYRAWRSPNDVFEFAADEDADGQPDQWSVLARTGRPGEMSYTLFDGNGDGEPDRWTVMIDGLRMGYDLDDDDGDGMPDNQAVWVPNWSGEFWTAYCDLDLDGRLDTMFDRDNLQRFVLMDSSWVPATGLTGDPPTRAYLVQDGTKGDEVVFESGEWRVRR